MSETIRFDILMPTYNDEKYIATSIQSVLRQSYKNWRLIIVDDGSTDNTAKLVASIQDKRIIYIYQENKDQLNALLTAAEYVKNDIVMLLHSDDCFTHNDVLAMLACHLVDDVTIDGLYGDYILINGLGEPRGKQETLRHLNEDIFFFLLTNRAANPIGDPFCLRKSVFLSLCYNNYLIDNTIYYIDYSSSTILNLKKVMPWYKYRVFEENYIHSDVGKFVLINGCLRTIYKLVNSGLYLPPLVVNHRYVFKVIKKLGLICLLMKSHTINYKFIYNYFKIWRNDLEKQEYPELVMKQLDQLIHSAEVRIKDHYVNPLYITITDDFYYQGKDARRFYFDYAAKKTKGLYHDLLEKKYDHIIVKNETDYKIVMNALKFYSFFYPVYYEK